MNLTQIEQRLSNGEGLTLQEAKELVSLLKGAKFDLVHELNEAFQDSVLQLRELVRSGGDTAKIQAARELIKMHGEQVITEDGNVTIDFANTDFSEEAEEAHDSSAAEATKSEDRQK